MTEQIEFTSDTLTAWGHVPGKAFGAALRDGTAALEQGKSLAEVQAMLESYKPGPVIKPAASGEKPFHVNIEADDPDATIPGA